MFGQKKNKKKIYTTMSSIINSYSDIFFYIFSTVHRIFVQFCAATLVLEVYKGLIQKGNVLRPNTIKSCLVTKHVDVELGSQTVSNVPEWPKCFVMFDEMLDVIKHDHPAPSKKCPKGKMFGHQMFDRVLAPNTSRLERAQDTKDRHRSEERRIST